jgi:selT/selW/selH-like putative selenoprotein
LPRASSLAAEIKQHRGVDSTLIRGSGGEFEITVDGRLVFSKKQEGRFPYDIEEVLALISA